MGSAPKAVARALIEIAQEAAADPSSVLPDCEAECSRCPWKGMEGKLRRISSLRGSKGSLKWATRWGEPLVRGYAALVMLADEEDMNYIAHARLGDRQVRYVIEGGAPKDVMIGLLNRDDPTVRLLAYRRLAESKGASVFATKRGLYCLGDMANVPADTLSDILADSPYRFTKTQSGLRCAHRPGEGGASMLVLKIGSARVEICSACAKRDFKLPTFLASEHVGPRLSKWLGVSVSMGPECVKDCGACAFRGAKSLDPQSMDGYLNGKSPDGEVLRAGTERCLASAKKLIIVLGSKCYGSDIGAAIAAVGASDGEGRALAAALKTYPGAVMVDDPSVGRLLSAIWAERGLTALKAVTPEETARELYKEDEQPSVLLRRALDASKERDLGSRLPSYRSLGAEASFADNVARAYKLRGTKASCEVIEHHTPQGHCERALALALLKALGAEGSKVWRYTREEQELGASLVEHARKLLVSEGKDYDEALRGLIALSGSSCEIN